MAFTALIERLQAAGDEGLECLFLSFEEVEVLCGPLPSDAYLKKAWWTNTRHAHVAAWVGAGWVVDTVGFGMRRVALRRC